MKLLFRVPLNGSDDLAHAPVRVKIAGREHHEKRAITRHERRDVLDIVKADSVEERLVAVAA
eukprot:7353335-Prymnesium_polylepis.1